MPLNQGKSKEAVSSNIEQLQSEGKPRKQAIAIALETQRRAKAKKMQDETEPAEYAAFMRPGNGFMPKYASCMKGMAKYVAGMRSHPQKYAQDASGHEHKGKGQGGGQFTSQGNGEEAPKEDDIEHEAKKAAIVSAAGTAGSVAAGGLLALIGRYLWPLLTRSAPTALHRELPTVYVKDKSGHEHRGKGKGGGQFTARGAGGEERANEEPKGKTKEKSKDKKKSWVYPGTRSGNIADAVERTITRVNYVAMALLLVGGLLAHRRNRGFGQRFADAMGGENPGSHSGGYAPGGRQREPSPAEAEATIRKHGGAGDLRSAFRKAIFATHPDRGGNNADAQAVNAAREALKKQGVHLARGIEELARYVKDASGHEHAGKGKGGGRFTSTSGASPEEVEEKPKKSWLRSHPKTTAVLGLAAVAGILNHLFNRPSVAQGMAWDAANRQFPSPVHPANPGAGASPIDAQRDAARRAKAESDRLDELRRTNRPAYDAELRRAQEEQRRSKRGFARTPWNAEQIHEERKARGFVRGLETLAKYVQDGEIPGKTTGENRGKPGNMGPQLIDLPDIRQEDDFSCGAAAAMAVGKHFGVGPDSLEQWKAALGTTKQNSTSPPAIVNYLRNLGLQVTPMQHMTIDGLRDCWQKGEPVLCCVQEYGVPSKQTSTNYGHYVVCIGAAMGKVFVFDPSIDNALGRPGGSQGKGDDPDVLQSPGETMIDNEVFDKVWHDKDARGNEYDHYGIIVGAPVKSSVVAMARGLETLVRYVTDDNGREHDKSGRFAAGSGGGGRKGPRRSKLEDERTFSGLGKKAAIIGTAALAAGIVGTIAESRRSRSPGSKPSAGSRVVDFTLAAIMKSLGIPQTPPSESAGASAPETTAPEASSSAAEKPAPAAKKPPKGWGAWLGDAFRKARKKVNPTSDIPEDINLKRRAPGQEQRSKERQGGKEFRPKGMFARELDVRDPVTREVTATYLRALGFDEEQVRREIEHLSNVASQK